MICVICHGISIIEETVNEELMIKNDIVTIPVNAFVCQTCGERYYDRKTVRYLEKITKDIKSNSVHLIEKGKVLSVAAPV
jgi:YgiT-type zinc finger domain-containing protein